MKFSVMFVVLGSILATDTLSANQIYWTDRFSGSISVGDTTTGNITTILTDSAFTPWGITLDPVSDTIYFTNGTNASDTHARLFSMSTSGTGLTSLTTSSSGTRQLEIDTADGKLYWAAEGGIHSGDGDRISRVNVDGSSPQTLANSVFNPRAMALDSTSGKIYFDTFVISNFTRSIMSANLDGSNVQTVISGLDSTIWGMDIDTVNQHLYWGTVSTKDVFRSNLDGTDVTKVLSGLSFDVMDVKVDPIGGYIYAAGDNFNGPPGGAIVRAKLDGSDLTTLFSGVNATNIFVVSPVPEPTSFALLGVGGTALLLHSRLRRWSITRQ